MKNKKIFFVLAPKIYAALYDKIVILLDAENDKYISIINDAAHYLCSICEMEFIKINDEYHPIALSTILDIKQLNYWITHFLKTRIIYESIETSKKTICPGPLYTGGLADYKWGSKLSGHHLSQASFFNTIKAFFTLKKVHKMLKNSGIGSLIEFIKSTKSTRSTTPSEIEIMSITTAIDRASLVYPNKTDCLAWAATFVILALQKNWDAYLLIAIQANPFYAHAWAELDGKVINDDPRVAQFLSIILKEPQN